MTAGAAIVIVERNVRQAHPSFAAGGYIVLNLEATAFRNADLVPGDPRDMLEWCRSHACAVSAPAATDELTRRYRVDFPDEATFESFRQRFPRR